MSLSIVLFCTLPLIGSPASNSWTEVSSPPGGIIRRVLAEGSFALISTNQGPFQSLDHGRSWRKLDSLEPAFRIHSLSSLGDTLYGGTPAGLLKTGDGGRTWTTTFMKPSGPVDTVPPDRLSNGKNVFWLSEAGVQRSSISGGPAVTALTGSPDALAIFHGRLYVAFSGGLFSSDDDGNHWFEVTMGDWRHEYVRWVDADSGSLHVSSTRRDFRSEDGLRTWFLVPRTIPGPGAPGMHGIAKGGSFWLTRASSALLRRSQDQGRSWTLINPGLKADRLESLASIDSFLFAGSRHGGLFRSRDRGETWTPMIFENEILESGSLVRFRGELVLGNAEGVFRSGNGGETWSRVPIGWEPGKIAVMAVDGDRLFAATQRGLFHAVDSGGSWSMIHPLSAAVAKPPFTNLNAVAAKGPILVVHSSVFGLRQSEDSGKSWKEASHWFSEKKAWGLFIKDGSIFAPSTDGLYLGGREGRTWKLLLRGAEYQGNSRGYGVAAVAIQGATLFAGSDEGQVYASRDNGGRWVRLKPGLPMDFVSGLAVCDSGLYVMFEKKGIWRRSLADIGQEE